MELHRKELTRAPSFVPCMLHVVLETGLRHKTSMYFIFVCTRLNSHFHWITLNVSEFYSVRCQSDSLVHQQRCVVDVRRPSLPDFLFARPKQSKPACFADTSNCPSALQLGKHICLLPLFMLGTWLLGDGCKGGGSINPW